MRIELNIFKIYINKRNVAFFILTLAALIICFETLINLIKLDKHNEYYSHAFIIPLISGYLIYKKRRLVFSRGESSYTTGFFLSTVGIVLFVLGKTIGNSFGINDYSATIIFSVLLFWTGGIILLYGLNAFRQALFPLFFLLFMIPIPSLFMDRIIYLLNTGSAWITYVFFKLAGIQSIKEGFVFHCNGIDIVIDRQCSGIRSAMGLLIPTIFSSYLFLFSGWKRFLLISFVLPITILKNGFRIFVLSMIATRLSPEDPALLFLHLHGGIIFALPALCLLGFILILLIKSEKKR